MTHEVVTTAPILQMRRVRLRESQSLTQDFTISDRTGLKPRPPTSLFFLLLSEWGGGHIALDLLPTLYSRGLV